MMKKIILQQIVWLLCLVCLSSAHSQTIMWEGKKSSLLIGEQVSVLTDKTGQLSIEQVSSDSCKARFLPSDKKIFEWFLSGETIYWVKCSVNNTTNDKLLLEVAQPMLPSVIYYYQDTTHKWQSYKAGHKVKLYQREVKYHLPVFPLLANNQTVYLRIQPSGRPIPIKLWQAEAHESKVSIQKMVYGGYIGIMLFVIFFNIFAFITLKHITHAYYAVMVFQYFLFAAILDGYILYIFPNTKLIEGFAFTTLISVSQINSLLYTIVFLQLKKYDKKSYKVAIGFLVYFAVYLVVYWFTSLKLMAQFNDLNSAIGIFLMAIIGIRAGNRKNKLGYYFAWTYFILFVIATLEVSYNKIGSPRYLFDLDVSHVSLAILLEVFLLSYLLAKRVEWDRAEIENDKQKAQEQLLVQTQANERIVREQNKHLEEAVIQRTTELNQSLLTLRTTQNQLIQSEKLASLGELTAGIAHEIQNPLNFVNNFSELSVSIAEDLKEEMSRPDADKGYIEELLTDLTQNQTKINHHGKRASNIVKGMLEHSRVSTGMRTMTDINALADEYLRLSYHGMRAKDKTFNTDFTTDFDTHLPQMNIVSQDIGRVLLNLINNAFYAVNEKKKSNKEGGYQPRVLVSTLKKDNSIEIKVKDNGNGMPKAVKTKIFQPFFTTKPTGEGTGLGLSLSYDIVVKGHGGTLEVETTEGEGTAFLIILPIS